MHNNTNILRSHLIHNQNDTKKPLINPQKTNDTKERGQKKRKLNILTRVGFEPTRSDDQQMSDIDLKSAALNHSATLPQFHI